MIMPSLLLAGAALATGLLAPVFPQHTSEEDVVAAPENPHDRAPLNVVLEVTEDAWLRAPNEEWFEAQAELLPDRFEYVDELIEVEGDFEGGWQDTLGEYEFRYDEEEDEFAYWQFVSADTLTEGRLDFVQFCSSCHGFDGDGYGRSGQHLRPPPRNFLRPNFKFSKVPGSYLPSDEALIRLVQRGLNGTPMLPWALSEEQLSDIIQYVKSLSPEGQGWRDIYSEVGDIVESGVDPWVGREAEGLTRGEVVYHGLAKCHSCHPGYVTPERYAEINNGAAPREGLTYPLPKSTDNYQVLGHSMLLLPPDFTWHDVRAGTTELDLFETIASGIGGTAMPQWKGSIEDDDIWAMAHYVRNLVETYKNKPAERARFMAGLRN
jgi:mono/diheme cytochrome c family protein